MRVGCGTERCEANAGCWSSPRPPGWEDLLSSSIRASHAFQSSLKLVVSACSPGASCGGCSPSGDDDEDGWETGGVVVSDDRLASDFRIIMSRSRSHISGWLVELEFRLCEYAELIVCTGLNPLLCLWHDLMWCTSMKTASVVTIRTPMPMTTASQGSITTAETLFWTPWSN